MNELAHDIAGEAAVITAFSDTVIAPEPTGPPLPIDAATGQPPITFANEWDDGISLKPLHSFYHIKSKVRHWSQHESGCTSICPVGPSRYHIRGGYRFMNLNKGMCAKCIAAVKDIDNTEWLEHFPALHFEPKLRRKDIRAKTPF